MKNRIIAIILTATITVSLLAGCGKSNNADNIQDAERIESGSEVINNSVIEKDSEVVGKDGVSEIEIGIEDTSSELLDNTSKDSSVDTELDNPGKDDTSPDQNEGIIGNTDKSSKNLSVESDSGQNINSNTGTLSTTENSEKTSNIDAENVTTLPTLGNNSDFRNNNSVIENSSNIDTNISDNGSTDKNPETDNDNTTSIVMAESSKEAFDLINAERVKLGLKPAVWDEECERIALIRAEEIAAMGTSELSENAHAGFDKFWYENFLLCECVAWGYTNAGGAVNGWMNSDGHRNVLMDEGRVKLAVACCGTKWVAVNDRE